MLQIVVTLLIYLVLVIPMGRYLYHLIAGKHTAADPVFDRVDGVIYRVGHIDAKRQMSWKEYAAALLLTNGVMILVSYLVLRLQGLLFFNPNGVGAMDADLSLNTVISFMTNTNLQHYAGESGITYLSQMLVITFMMFVSAASGYAACAAFIRGLTGWSKTGVGNYFADLVRIITRVLLPFSIVGGLLLVWQGVPQNLSGNIVVDTLEGGQAGDCHRPCGGAGDHQALGNQRRRLLRSQLRHSHGKPHHSYQPHRAVFHDAAPRCLRDCLRQDGPGPQSLPQGGKSPERAG